MKIYTKKGDSGTTGLYRGERVSKSAPQIEINGAVDEAQSFIGLARSELVSDSELNTDLKMIEKDLWILMAEVATSRSSKVQPKIGVDKVSSQMVTKLETLTDQYSAKFEMPREFVVPGENKQAALLDVARTVVRRAERQVVQHMEANSESYILPYLNRLSDLLWTLSRYLEQGSVIAKEI